jgi:hypothetical protein
LSFFFTLDLEVGEALRWAHQRAGDEESAELVHGEERLCHRGVPRHVAVSGVTQDGALHVLGKPPRGEDPHAFGGMLLGRRVGLVGEPLVVEIVDQPDEAPAFRILTGALSHGTHRELDGVHVAPECFVLGVFLDEGERVFATEHGEGFGVLGSGFSVPCLLLGA